MHDLWQKLHKFKLKNLLKNWDLRKNDPIKVRKVINITKVSGTKIVERESMRKIVNSEWEDNKGRFRQLANFKMSFHAGVSTCFPIQVPVPISESSDSQNPKNLIKYIFVSPATEAPTHLAVAASLQRQWPRCSGRKWSSELLKGVLIPFFHNTLPLCLENTLNATIDFRTSIYLNLI